MEQDIFKLKSCHTGAEIISYSVIIMRIGRMSVAVIAIGGNLDALVIVDDLMPGPNQVILDTSSTSRDE